MTTYAGAGNILTLELLNFGMAAPGGILSSAQLPVVHNRGGTTHEEALLFGRASSFM